MSEATFDISFQRSVLRLMVHDEPFAMRALEHLQPSFFSTESLGWLFRTFKAYWDLYHVRMGEVPLRTYLRKEQLDKQMLFGTDVEMVLMPGPVLEATFVKHELREFVRMSVFSEAHRHSAKFFNEGAYDKAYDVMAAAQERIGRVSFDGPKRSFFFEELPQRQDRRMREAMDLRYQPRITGIRELDQMTDGGVHEGELWVVFAYAKRCKTTWLLNQGVNATRIHRQPTLHLSLEGKHKQIEDKYDSCFGSELYTKVKQGLMDSKAYVNLQEEYTRLRRLLVVRSLTDWNLTIDHIVAELDELRTQEDFEPTSLILDYMDLGRSRERANSEMDHQVAFARDLKRLITIRELATWSAWQGQRPKKGGLLKEHVLMSGDVADAYAKVRIVDSYGSLNATEDEMAKGEMRVFWEGYRDAPVGKLFRITNDLKTNRMINSSELIPFDPSRVVREATA